MSISGESGQSISGEPGQSISGEPGQSISGESGQSISAPTRGERKTRVGVVVSDRMDKTVVVLVERRTTHPLYRKIVTRSEKLHAHDEANDARVGDRVRVTETRPLSKTKHWRIVNIIERAK